MMAGLVFLKLKIGISLLNKLVIRGGITMVMTVALKLKFVFRLNQLLAIQLSRVPLLMSAV